MKPCGICGRTDEEIFKSQGHRNYITNSHSGDHSIAFCQDCDAEKPEEVLKLYNWLFGQRRKEAREEWRDDHPGHPVPESRPL